MINELMIERNDDERKDSWTSWFKWSINDERTNWHNRFKLSVNNEWTFSNDSNVTWMMIYIFHERWTNWLKWAMNDERTASIGPWTNNIFMNDERADSNDT